MAQRTKYAKVAKKKQGGKQRVQWLFIIPIAVVLVMIVILLLPRGKENLKYLSAEHQVVTPIPTKSPRELAWQQIVNADKSVVATLGSRVLAFSKQNGMQISVVEDDYVHRKVCVQITGLSGETISTDSLKGVFGDSYAEGFDAIKATAVGSMYEDCAVSYEDAENGTKTATIWFEQASVYECRVAQDSNYYYLDWYRPKELYDKIVVVDAGHGGEDLGAVVSGTKTYEKNVTLSYLLGIKALADEQQEIKFYYTRTTDANCSTDYGESLELRTDLVANVDADLFLSIHLNSNENKSYHGTEMYYNETQDSWTGFNSRAFAEILMENVTKALGTVDNGYGAAATTLSMVKYVDVPVTLAELCYISNEGDRGLVLDESKKRATEEALFASIQEAFRIMESEK